MKERKYNPLFLDSDIRNVFIFGFTKNHKEVIKNSINSFDSEITICDSIENQNIDAVIAPENIYVFPQNIKNIPVYKIDLDNLEYTESQQKLINSDWQVIKELEKLLPTDNPLRLERDQLRAAVSQEIENFISQEIEEDVELGTYPDLDSSAP